MPIITLSAYAKHSGCSPAAITKLIKQGKLSGALVKVTGRKKPMIDVEIADQIRADNFHPAYQDGQASAAAKKAIGKPARKSKTKLKTTETETGAKEKPGQTLNDFRRLHEGLKVKLKDMEAKEKEGKLIPADEAAEVWTRHILAVKTKVLGIKGKCAQLIFELVPDPEDREAILLMIDSAARETLVDLADGDK